MLKDNIGLIYFPAFLDLRGKSCLVVGAGEVAFKKAAKLSSAGARVTVVGPDLSPRFGKMSGIRVKRRSFRSRDLDGAWLVVAATNDETLNARVFGLCGRRRVWVNAVDRPRFCSFIFPSVVRRGGLSVAISTGGASPALSKFVRKRIQEELGPEYGRFVALLKAWRPRILREPPSARRRIWRRIVSDDFLALVRRRGARVGEQKIKEMLNGKSAV